MARSKPLPDQQIMNFALKWRHWGGGSAGDIFIEFGLTPVEFFRRLEAFLNAGAANHLPTDVAQQLRNICRGRLATGCRA
ncbi:hypothetical protein FCG67_18755 [Rhodococcus oryzae]|uniref:DUF3263 domain-containing protein n=1 Tax=Rhodococcus oryzae TaxID=2571143 RepID=A0ABY2RGK2_9NOCA|nr:hypothetical protein [Rhodococcus oryzae]TJZ76055.1 hypothetical protein FCG67_18755 [Rhodococcus oryzae]